MQSDAKDGEEKWANAIHAGGADGPVWDRMSADPFVQRELRDLSALETPYLGEVESVPIHAPEEIDGWGRPIGTVYVTGFSRFSRWLGSGSLIVFGLSFIAVGIGAAFLTAQSQSTRPGRGGRLLHLVWLLIYRYRNLARVPLPKILAGHFVDIRGRGVIAARLRAPNSRLARDERVSKRPGRQPDLYFG